MTPLSADPWPHLVLDNFLPATVFQECLREIGAEDYNFEIENRGTGRIEFSLLKSKIAWRAIYSKETIALLSLAFGVKVKLNRDNYVQLRRMNAATPEFPVHNDFASNEDTIASFLYLSPGWRSSCGGRLHLYEAESQNVPSLSIAPLSNRMVAFRTLASNWHSVERVCGWERLSILALWDIEES
jgi:2-oxoglutarate-Fe(II)-dependent oxygenase superfamily protein